MNTVESSLEPDDALTPTLITVIVPTFNGRRYICDALDTVHRQTHRPIELIVVDDASTDGTADVVARWAQTHDSADFRVLVKKNTGKGASSSRNLGVLFSHGQYLQFLDHDDLLHKDKLQLQLLEARRSDADLIVGRNRGFNDITEIAEILDGPASVKAELPVPSPFFSEMRWSHLGWFVRRDLMKRVGPWNEQLRLSDYEMDVRLKLTARRIGYVSALLSFWRMSNPDSESKQPAVTIFRWRIDVIDAVVRQLERCGVTDPKEYAYMARSSSVTAARCLRRFALRPAIQAAGIAARCRVTSWKHAVTARQKTYFR